MQFKSGRYQLSIAGIGKICRFKRAVMDSESGENDDVLHYRTGTQKTAHSR